jgi:hypothetical protein
LPVNFCSTVYLCTGSCMRGSMQAKIIASSQAFLYAFDLLELNGTGPPQ